MSPMQFKNFLDPLRLQTGENPSQKSTKVDGPLKRLGSVVVGLIARLPSEHRGLRVSSDLGVLEMPDGVEEGSHGR